MGRPQNAPYQLKDRGADIAIIGEDCVRDANITGTGVRLIGGLDYGEVKIVVAVSNTAPYESLDDFFLSKHDETKKDETSPIICYSELVNLAADYFMNNERYIALFGNMRPTIEIDGHRFGDNPNVIIRKSYGHTEAYVGNEAEIIVENTHTGNTLREYDLRTLEQIMKSYAGLYAGPSCVGWKEKKALEIYERLRKAARELGHLI